jgi:hypothetical protein
MQARLRQAGQGVCRPNELQAKLLIRKSTEKVWYPRALWCVQRRPQGNDEPSLLDPTMPPPTTNFTAGNLPLIGSNSLEDTFFYARF